MILEWTIRKKRGNYRPMLEYSISLESFERNLAVPQVVLDSSIPRPPQGWTNHCHPGHAERAGLPCETYRLHTPSHKQGKLSDSLRLPWREDGEYPEVETSFRLLREHFEIVLKNTYDSQPFEQSGRLELSGETRRHVATGVAAQRFLQAVGL